MARCRLIGGLVLLCAASVSGQSAAHSYTCEKSFDAAMGKFKGNHPMHAAFSEAGHRFATGIAQWAREVLALSEEEAPMAFAYYSNSGDTPVDCGSVSLPPYIQHGAGEQLCSMLEWAAGVGHKDLGSYLTRVLNTACTTLPTGCESHNATLDWNSTASLVPNLGYRGYSIIDAWRSSCPHGVYNPEGLCATIPELERRNANPANSPFYGLSGGGGSGAGFDLFCVDAAGVQTRLVGGGGGGGSGMNSPEQCIPFQAGGGGGGGVDVGRNASDDTNPSLGAGAGGGVAGFGMGQDGTATPEQFSAKLAGLATAMRACQAAGDSVVIRGGGGGGGGVEAYQPYNMSNCSADPTPTDISAFGIGYGFQFAIGGGDHARLEPNASPEEDVYVACPKGDGACHNCVTPETAAPPTSAPAPPQNQTYWNGVSNAFRCADAYARGFCTKAKTASGASYGTYTHYGECNCPVSRYYLFQHLPDETMWAHVRTGECTYPDPSQPVSLPEVSVADIHRHPGWVPETPAGCNPLVPGRR